MMTKDACFCRSDIGLKLFSVFCGDIVQCANCGVVRTRYARQIKQKQAYTRADFDFYIREKAKFTQLFERVVGQIKRFKQNGRLLEVGSSIGFLLEVAQGEGFAVQGVEPGKWACGYAQKTLGIKTHCGDLQSTRFPPKYFDVVIYNHVLEHTTNPQHELRLARKILKKDGLLVIGVPNFGSFFAQLKKARWQSIIPDQHRWHFTLQSLNNLLDTVGFRPVYTGMENHDRSMHYWWKKPLYVVFDAVAVMTNRAEAMLVFYEQTH